MLSAFFLKIVGSFTLSKRGPMHRHVTEAGAILAPRLRGAGTIICAGVLSFAALAAQARAEDLPRVLEECAACHGADGIGRDEEIPNLAGQHERYLHTQLQAFKSGKRPHKEMRYESRHLSDEEMQALARYYAQLPR